VKLRGYRIELGEIEAVLAGHPRVREAVARVLRDDAGDARLVAYLETEAEAPEAATLRAYLAERLPSHMVPSGFEILEQLPRTPNGKVDRRALPEPGAVGPGGERFYVPPSNDGEREIAALWEEILEVERVGIHDNFFELGGHSLLATRVVARLQRSHGIQLPLRTLFELPTVAQLAPRVAAERKGRDEHDKIAAALATLENMSEEEASRLLETVSSSETGDEGPR
jgi:acyl carrier protein